MSEYLHLRNGNRIFGTVMHYRNSLEFIADIHAKYTGIVRLYSESSREIAPIGDELELIVTKVDDTRGICYLAIYEEWKQHQNQQNTYQIVDEVMSQVRSNLSAMKPALIKEIVSEVSVQIKQNYQTENEKLRKRISELEKRVSQLENKSKTVSSPPPYVPPVSTPQTVDSKTKPVFEGSYFDRYANKTNTLTPAEVDKILSFPNFYREANGWIYYIKIVKNAGNYYGGIGDYGELYKVRPDGTENQKIFDEKVSIVEFFAEYDFRIDGDKLSFKDAQGRDRTIRI